MTVFSVSSLLMWVLIVTIIAMNITMNDIRNNHWILPRILPWMLPWMLPCILPWILPWIYKHSLPCVPFLHKKIGVVNCFVIGVIIEAVKRNPHPLFLFSHWIFTFTHVGAHPHPKTCCHIFYSLVLINLVCIRTTFPPECRCDLLLLRSFWLTSLHPHLHQLLGRDRDEHLVGE